MERILIALLPDFVGKEVIVKGWVHRIRQLGGINFVILRDRTGTVQTVFQKSEELSGIRNEMVVEVGGKVVSEPRAPGGIELSLIHI